MAFVVTGTKTSCNHICYVGFSRIRNHTRSGQVHEGNRHRLSRFFSDITFP
uniref:Uncharacterized protein n=1 Tax=Siphoviridae sp. ctBLh2 TaxID=2827803 RepID=A0A8S5S375_9CAUD|nr:MAG TPA: hypothetical protein [Siphoviridae sp. ctBLh2]